MDNMLQSPPPLEIEWGLIRVPKVSAVNAAEHLHPPEVLRNYGDIIYNLPELAAFRYQPGAEWPSTEPGDAAPVPRTFVRRLVGATAEPLTLASTELDRLPLYFDPERAPLEWVGWFLAIGGLRVPSDTPARVQRDLLNHVDELYPLGRFEGLVRLAEIALGRAQRTVTPEGASWLHTRLDLPGGARLTISECWHASSVDRSVGNRAVRITSAGVPTWAAALLELNTTGYFTVRVERDEDAFGGELLLGSVLL